MKTDPNTCSNISTFCYLFSFVRFESNVSPFASIILAEEPAGVTAIKDMLKHGQLYLGTFLFKDQSTDSKITIDVNSVHPVKVFAQITCIFVALGSSRGREGEAKEEVLMAVTHTKSELTHRPLRRISSR